MDALSAIALAMSALGTGVGAYSDIRNANNAQEISSQNLDEQRRANQVQEALTRELLGIQKEGYSGPTGTTRYVPGRGMVTTLSPIQQALFDAENQAAMRRLSVEEPAAMDERMQAMGSRASDRGAADQIRQRMMMDFNNAPTTADLEGLLTTSRAGTINAIHDQLQNDVLTQNLRSGGDATPLMKALSQQRMNALAPAMGSIPLEAAMGIGEFRNSKLNADAPLFSMFNASASGIPTTPLLQTGGEDQQTAMTANAGGNLANGFALAAGAIKPAQQTFVPSSNALGSALGQSGNLLMAMQQRNQSQQNFDTLFGNVNDRQRGNTSSQSNNVNPF